MLITLSDTNVSLVWGPPPARENTSDDRPTGSLEHSSHAVESLFAEALDSVERALAAKILRLESRLQKGKCRFRALIHRRER